MSETIQVNFRHSIPLFPLPDTVLLPHAILPLHVFEPRYVQMVSECLDGSGQIAIGTVATQAHDDALTGSISVLPVTCVGQIVQHDVLADGRYNILLHGVCRAKITRVIEPDGDRRFRMARLVPLEPTDHDDDTMPFVRDEFRVLLSGPRLRRLRGTDTLLEWIDRDDVPTPALLELIGFAIVRETRLKYQLLAEPDIERRAGIIRAELKHIDQLVTRADRQGFREWPKGVSWN
ncbi:MAG: LON peptidase substrate-binding domain-containing protein [Planctomycetes bacterium]|nr:LON peptidase substrate-binding domain-containing protein [Planctomycetota bacterium]